jgi:SAM-dependent methyltransferase
MLDTVDISPKDFYFDPNIGTSLRDRLRDTADKIIRRPFYRKLYSQKFSHLPYPIDLVLPEKGMSILARREWVNKYVPLQNSRILVIGCGSGWDFGSYLNFQPQEIVGVDLYNFRNCWQQVENYVAKSGLPTKVTFHQLDIAQLDQAVLGEFDVICSDAVFEHCRELNSVVKTLYNLLTSQGIMYAAYSPLWYCWGGDHFSGRGGIEQGYNHLLLESEVYQDYYRTHLRDAAFELQNGGRYIELDLFSKLSSQEYFSLYDQVGFSPKSVILEFSAYAESLRLTPIFEQLINRFPNLDHDDFLLKSHLVIMAKNK